MLLTKEEYEVKVRTLDQKDLTSFLMCEGFLVKEVACPGCNKLMSFAKFANNKDEYAWRCYSNQCTKKKAYRNLRLGSFFEGFNISLRDAMKVVLKYGVKQPLHSIKLSLDLPDRTIDRVIKEFKKRIPKDDFTHDKLGGPGVIVQVDETMLNHSVKAHRGRAPGNRTDALCMIEYGKERGRTHRLFLTRRRQRLCQF